MSKTSGTLTLPTKSLSTMPRGHEGKGKRVPEKASDGNVVVSFTLSTMVVGGAQAKYGDGDSGDNTDKIGVPQLPGSGDKRDIRELATAA